MLEGYYVIGKDVYFMQDKSSYKTYLHDVSKYVKLSRVCKELGISYSMLNSFLNKDRDENISVDNLKRICDFISEKVA